MTHYLLFVLGFLVGAAFMESGYAWWAGAFVTLCVLGGVYWMAETWIMGRRNAQEIIEALPPLEADR